MAVTRAKRQVILYASFAPEDIELERTSSVGLTHLRDYLALAARGAEAVKTLKPVSVTEAHREAVADALAEAGLLVRRGIGLSDFTIDLAVAADDSGPWVAVLLDGPGWAGRKTVGDRDALPSALLQGLMGWPAVEHVWLPSWLAERERVVERIVGAAHGRGTAPGVGAGRRPPGAERGRGVQDTVVGAGPMRAGAAVRDEVSEPKAPAGGEDGSRFVAAATTGLEEHRDRLDHLGDRRTAAAVREVALDVIATESPIEAGRLARIVGNRFGFQRVVAKRAAEILTVVPRGLRRSSDLGTFYWAEGTTPESYRGFRRTPEGVSRSLAEVAPEEIANAMAQVVRASHRIEVEELLREAAAVFGTQRVTPPVRERLEAVLAWAVRDGRLQLDGDRVHS